MIELKTRLLEVLRERGLEGLQAEPWEMVKRVTAPRAALRINRVRALEAGFQRYLGTDDLGNERYGMELEVEFALQLLSPREQGAYGAEIYGQKVLSRLILDPEAVPAGEILWGQIQYDPKRDCFRQEVTLKLGVLAVAARDSDRVLLTDIQVRATRS